MRCITSRSIRNRQAYEEAAAPTAAPCLTQPRYPVPAVGAAGKLRKLGSMERKQQSVPVRNLREVRGWAQERLRAGGYSTWSHYQHMKLIEAIDAILSDDSMAGASVAALPTAGDEADPPQAEWPVQVLS